MFRIKNYDKTNPQSILSFAKQLIGHTFMDVLENELSEDEFQKVYGNYFKYCCAISDHLRGVRMGIAAGGVFPAVCDRVDRGDDRESAGPVS